MGANKIACSDCSGNMNDGFVMEEIVVTGYQNSYNYDIVWLPPNYTYNDYENYNYPEIPISPVGGYGGSSNNNNQEKREKKKKVVEQKKKSDCDAVTLANRRAAHPDVQAVINNIKDKGVEWGSSITTANPESGTTINVGAAYTNGKTNTISISPKWSDTGGYQVGFIHNHPNGSAPSPSDIYHAVLNLNTMVDMFSVNDKQISSYIDNFTSIIVSGGQVYTISMKNPLLVSYMQSGGYNGKLERERYEGHVERYLDDNSIVGPTPAQYQMAGEYALLRLYGDQVHITKHKIGETNKSEVLKLENNKKVKKEKPC